MARIKTSISIEEKKELESSYKIKSYKKKIEFMQKSKIPQKEIKEVLEHLFTKNTSLSEKTKNSVSKIIYSVKDRIIIAITNHGKEFIWNRDKFIRLYGWFFFVTETEEGRIAKKKEKNDGWVESGLSYMCKRSDHDCSHGRHRLCTGSYCRPDRG